MDDIGLNLPQNFAKHAVIVALLVFELLDRQPWMAKHAVNFQTAMHLRFAAGGNIFHLMVRGQNLHFMAPAAQPFRDGPAMQLIPSHIMRGVKIADDQDFHGTTEALTGGVGAKPADGVR